MAQQQPVPPPWSDWPGFRAFVLSECDRLNAPRPTEGQLRILYIDRRAELARVDAWAEIHGHEQASTPTGVGGRRRGGARP